MTVHKLIKALERCTHLQDEVVVLDKQGKFEHEIATVEEADDRVCIVIEEWPL
ncbi:MAG: hypothetical protein L0338_24510 [Acidobacteria bacterium]|nr:hypothetical protein [Acidobacteriota bacterium]